MNKSVKYITCLLASVIISGLICELYGDDWEQQVRNDLYRLKGSNVPAFSQEFIDSSGIPYVIYYPLNGTDAGKQYNPTIVCNYAIEYFENLSNDKPIYKERFLHSLEWLKQNITYKDDAAFYIFNWRQPWYDSVGIPFTSGMTSGLAIQVFTDGYRLTKDSSYLHLAKALLRGFFVPIERGGFTYQTKEGWWYEEVADSNMHTPFILDGHIFACTGVHHYFSVTGDDSANFVFEKGISALKHTLPEFDKGDGYAYYDKYKKPADKHYQRVLAGQMKQLWEITGDKTFLNFYEKWKKPFSKPYLFRVIREGNISGLLLISLLALPFCILSFILIRRKLI